MNEDVDPAEFYERIESKRSATVECFFSLLMGTSDEYENLFQVLDDFAWFVKATVLELQKEGITYEMD